MKKNKGFTLAELLIVVAIIAVLVAIAIPVFTSQLEKSREATDLANVRSAYAELMATIIVEDDSKSYINSDGNLVAIKTNDIYSIEVPLKQKVDDWQSKLPITIAGVLSESVNGGNPPAGEDGKTHWEGVPGADGTCIISYSEADGVLFSWNGGTQSPLAHYTNTIETVFSEMLSDKKGDGFIVANSTCPGMSGRSIGIINEKLANTDSNIKTWAIIINSANKNDYKDQSKANYLISEEDISDKSVWKAGDKVPAILQKANGEYEVGMATVYLEKDRTPNYNIISRDGSGLQASQSNYGTYNIETVLTGDKRTFSSMDEAYAYYQTLEPVHN